MNAAGTPDFSVLEPWPLVLEQRSSFTFEPRAVAPFGPRSSKSAAMGRDLSGGSLAVSKT